MRREQDFDRVCDQALAVFAKYCRNYRVVEREVTAPRTVKVLEPV